MTTRTGRRSLPKYLLGLVLLAAIAIAVAGQAEGGRRQRPPPGVLHLEAEDLPIKTVGGRDGPGWNIWSNGSIGGTIEIERSGRYPVVVRARSRSVSGVAPRMEVRLDGELAGSFDVPPGGWAYRSYRVEVELSAGEHELSVAFVNDSNRPDDDRDLVVDWIRVGPGDSPDPDPGPDPDPDPDPEPVPTTRPEPPPSPSSSIVPPPSPEPPEPAPPTSPPEPPEPPTTPPEPPTTLPEPPEPPEPPTTRPEPPPSSTTTTRPDGGERSPFVPADYQLTWRDEFDDLSLDLGRNGGGDWLTLFHGWNVLSLAGNGDQCMKSHPGFTGTGGPALGLETHRVEDGVLTLFGRPIPQERRGQFWGYEAACGMISGELSHNQTYGYWEVRMRVSSISKGHHWAIWLLPENGQWPPETDIFEVVGTSTDGGRNNSDRRFHFTGHWPTGGGKDSSMSHLDAPREADDWYVLGLEWTPDGVVWFLDGREAHRLWNFMGSAPHYFLISPEVSGNWPGRTDRSTDWPTSMEVDYVRIYQRP